MDDRAKAEAAAIFDIPAQLEALGQKLLGSIGQVMVRLRELEARVADMEKRLPRPLKSRKETAEHLGVGLDKVDSMIRDGQIQTVRNGKRILCDLSSIKPVDLAEVTARMVLGKVA
jgi:hypothetical protein